MTTSPTHGLATLKLPGLVFLANKVRLKALSFYYGADSINALLDISILYRDISTMRLAISSGANPNHLVQPEYNDEIITPLTRASGFKHLEAVCLILEKGDFTHQYGQQEVLEAFHTAVRNGSIDIIRELFAHPKTNAYLSAQNILSQAVENHAYHPNTVTELLNLGANLQSIDLNKMLLESVKAADIEMVDFLCQHGADVNKVTRHDGFFSTSYYTPIMWAVYGRKSSFRLDTGFLQLEEYFYQFKPVIETLINYGADPRKKGCHADGNAFDVAEQYYNGDDLQLMKKLLNQCFSRKSVIDGRAASKIVKGNLDPGQRISEILYGRVNPEFIVGFQVEARNTKPKVNTTDEKRLNNDKETENLSVIPTLK